MRLTSAKIKDFRAIRDLEIPLDRSLTVLHGENAQGKTSVLSAIALGLSRIPKLLGAGKAYTFNPADVRIGTGFAGITLETTEGLRWITSEMASFFPRAFRTADRQKNGEKLLKQHLSELGAAIAANATVELPVVAFYDTERAVFGLPQRRRDFNEIFTRFDAYDDALTAKASFKALFEWFYAKESDELRLRRDGPSKSAVLPELQAVRRAIEGMMRDIHDPHIETNPLRFVVCMDRPGQKPTRLALDQLSGGYRIVLALVSDLARRMALANPHLEDPLSSEAIVLIDEVELHLHPSWQQRVLIDLQNTFPNTQFIVSTHSPQVLTTVRPEQIVHLRASEDGVVAEASSGATYGARSGDVLEVEMGVEQRPNNAFTEKLADYMQMIRSGEGDSLDGLMLRAELDALSPHNPALIAADIEMRRRRVMQVATNQPA